MTTQGAVDAALAFVSEHPSILEKLCLSKAANAARADDVAINSFAHALSDKMTHSRAKGRGGWQTCPVPDLWAKLREHVEKGDPRDVALFAMMIWYNSGEAERG